MAAFPYVNSSAYGGYFTLENDRYSVDLGVQRRYDSYRQQWIVSPILTPKYHFSKKFTIEVPVGEWYATSLKNSYSSVTTVRPQSCQQSLTLASLIQGLHTSHQSTSLLFCGVARFRYLCSNE